MLDEKTYALPDNLQAYGGSILDVDSHEMMPAQVWVEEMGEVMSELADVFLKMENSSNPVHPNQAGYLQDDVKIQPETIWNLKGARSPGATNIDRRLEVMDLIGVKRQLMFPGVGLFGLIVTSQDNLLGLKGDYVAYGHKVVKAANEWAVRVGKTSDRIRPVVTLVEDTPQQLVESARKLIDEGIRAVWLPNSIPPGGVSPAHPDLDPLWAMLAERKVALCLHVGLDTKVGGTDVWKKAPAFTGFKTGAEFDLDPWTMSSIYLAAQNMVLTMVLGGVFDRHPDLRMGVIEAGAFWIGPLSEQLDMFYNEDPGGVKKSGTGYRLPHLPSYYIKNNIRVSGFDFEPIGTYIERYDMEDVFCFATDYPHLEGGKDPVGDFYQSIVHLGQPVVEKFFLKNAEWLLPE